MKDPCYKNCDSRKRKKPNASDEGENVQNLTTAKKFSQGEQKALQTGSGGQKTKGGNLTKTQRCPHKEQRNTEKHKRPASKRDRQSKKKKKEAIKQLHTPELQVKEDPGKWL